MVRLHPAQPRAGEVLAGKASDSLVVQWEPVAQRHVHEDPWRSCSGEASVVSKHSMGTSAIGPAVRERDPTSITSRTKADATASPERVRSRPSRRHRFRLQRRDQNSRISPSWPAETPTAAPTTTHADGSRPLAVAGRVLNVADARRKRRPRPRRASASMAATTSGRCGGSCEQARRSEQRPTRAAPPGRRRPADAPGQVSSSCAGTGTMRPVLGCLSGDLIKWLTALIT